MIYNWVSVKKRVPDNDNEVLCAIYKFGNKKKYPPCYEVLRWNEDLKIWMKGWSEVDYQKATDQYMYITDWCEINEPIKYSGRRNYWSIILIIIQVLIILSFFVFKKYLCWI